MTTTAQYEAVFDKMDADGSGQVDVQEMRQMMLAKGGFSADQIERFFRSADVSDDGKVTRTEFLTAMGCASPEELKAATWRRAFQGFDHNKDGTINRAELKSVLEEAGKELSEDEVNRAMEMMDSSGDDVITYEEFITRFVGAFS